MTSVFFKKTYLKIIAFGAYLILFVPFITGEGSFLAAPLLPRVMYLYTLIDIIFVAYLLLVKDNPEYRPRLSVITIGISLFMLTLLVTTFTGVDPAASFLGLPNRIAGYLTLLHFFIFFIVLSSIFKSWDQWKWIFRVACAVCFLVIFHNIVFLAEFNVVSLLTDRPASILANVGTYAVFLLINIFLILYLIFKEENKFYKIFEIVTLIVAVLSLIITENRAAFLGLFAGIAVLMFFYLLFSKNKKIHILLVSIFTLMILLPSLLFFVGNTNFIQNPFPLYNLTNVSFRSASIAGRILSWEMAFKAFMERPFRAWGLQNYRIAEDKYYNSLLYESGYRNIWFDDPHNKILDVLVTGGIFGLIFYLSIFVFCFYLLWKQRHNSPKEVIILVAFLISYFINNIFTFDTDISYLLFFIFLAYVSSIFGTDILTDKNSSKLFLRKIFVYGLIIIAVFNLFKFTIQPTRAAYYAYKCAPDYFPGKDLENCDKVMALAPFLGPEFAKMLYDFNKQLLKIDIPYDDQYKKFINISTKINDEVFNLEPKYSQYMYNAAKIYRLLYLAGRGDYSDQKMFFEKSESMYLSAIELTPGRQILYFDLFDLYLMNKQQNKAENIVKKNIAANKGTSEALWNLGFLHLKMGLTAKGLQEIKEATELGFTAWKDDPEISKIINEYIQFVR